MIHILIHLTNFYLLYNHFDDDTLLIDLSEAFDSYYSLFHTLLCIQYDIRSMLSYIHWFYIVTAVQQYSGTVVYISALYVANNLSLLAL